MVQSKIKKMAIVLFIASPLFGACNEIMMRRQLGFLGLKKAKRHVLCYFVPVRNRCSRLDIMKAREWIFDPTSTADIVTQVADSVGLGCVARNYYRKHYFRADQKESFPH